MKWRTCSRSLRYTSALTICANLLLSHVQRVPSRLSFRSSTLSISASFRKSSNNSNPRSSSRVERAESEVVLDLGELESRFAIKPRLCVPDRKLLRFQPLLVDTDGTGPVLRHVLLFSDSVGFCNMHYDELLCRMPIDSRSMY